MLIWRQELFQREVSTKFSIFLNQNILFLECSKKDQTYISDILMLLQYILRIKILKMRKWGQSFLEQAKFYAECNNYSYAAHNDAFFKSLTTRYILQITVWTQGPAWSLNKFSIFLNQNILFPECSEKIYFRYFDATWIYIKNQN